MWYVPVIRILNISLVQICKYIREFLHTNKRKEKHSERGERVEIINRYILYGYAFPIVCDNVSRKVFLIIT